MSYVTVADRTALAALSPADGDRATLYEDIPALKGRMGEFIFSSANLKLEVGADPNQGVFVAPTSAPSGSSGAWMRQIDGVFPRFITPEMFGFIPADGATTANDNAFDACVRFAYNLIWRETDNDALPAEVEFLPIVLGPGIYKYSGNGIDTSTGGVTKTLSIRGQGCRRTMLRIESDVFLFKWGDTSQLDIHDIHFSGGKGIYIQQAPNVNTRDYYSVTGCRFEGFTVCAIGSNSIDMPNWKIRSNIFAGEDGATAVALSGLTDLCDVAFNEFIGMRYHVKVGRGGNNIRIHDNFFATVKHSDGARVWVVLEPTATVNFGEGGHLINNNFGNEKGTNDPINTADRPILVAQEDVTNSNFYDRYHSTDVSDQYWQGWTIDGNLFAGSTGQTEALITSYTRRVGGMFFGPSNLIAGSTRPYVWKFDSAIPSLLGGASAKRNTFYPPLQENGFAVAAMRMCNLPGFAIPIDPARTMLGQGTYNLAAGRSTSATLKVEDRGIDYVGPSSTAITTTPAAEDYGENNAVEVTSSATNGEVALVSVTPTVGRTFWVHLRLKKSSANALDSVRLKIYRVLSGQVEKSEQIELTDQLLDWIVPVQVQVAGALRISLVTEGYTASNYKFICGNYSVIETETPPNIGHLATLGYGSGSWHGPHVLLGSYHLWVDSSGKLRIKSSAPASDIDGTIVGTQT